MVFGLTSSSLSGSSVGWSFNLTRQVPALKSCAAVLNGAKIWLRSSASGISCTAIPTPMSSRTALPTSGGPQAMSAQAGAAK